MSLGGMLLAMGRKMSLSSFKWQILGLLKVESLKMEATRSLEKSVIKPRRSFESLVISVRDHQLTE